MITRKRLALGILDNFSNVASTNWWMLQRSSFALCLETSTATRKIQPLEPLEWKFHIIFLAIEKVHTSAILWNPANLLREKLMLSLSRFFQPS